MRGLTIKKQVLFFFAALFLGLVLSAILLLFLVPPVWRLDTEQSFPLTRWHQKQGEYIKWVGPTRSDWVALEAMSQYVLAAIILAEDANFYKHHGLDFSALIESLRLNLAKGRYLRGGSTLESQLVRTLFLSREKTLQRKFSESLGALVLDLVLDKDRILEWYINTAEFGVGVYGFKDATTFYFNTKPELLTINQSIYLALLLPRPNISAKELLAKKLSAWNAKRFASIVRQLYDQKRITLKQYEQALATGNFGQPIVD